MKNTDQVTVIKLNLQGEETWRYDGQIIEQDINTLLVEAYFNRSDMVFHGITLKENDRFLERYYQDRWYNIFEIHDRDDQRLKAWYCNITRPAAFSPGKIAYVDLALDLLVYPQGEYLVLDEDEFADLPLDQDSRIKALAALEKLIQLAETDRLRKAIQ